MGASHSSPALVGRLFTPVSDLRPGRLAPHFPKPVGRAPCGVALPPCVRLPAASGPPAFLGVTNNSGRCGTRTHDLSRVKAAL
jgi:hypothetical protein